MKAFIKCLIILVGFLQSHVALSCICSSQNWNIFLVQKNISLSDFIFLGKVIKTKDHQYSFKVIEAFKGVGQGDTINGEAFSTCSMVPYIGGLWVIYTKADKNSIIDFSVCSLSRSLTTFSPRPPLPGFAITESLYEKIRGKELSLAMLDWKNEYSMLKGLKESYPANAGKEKESENYILTYIALGLALIALLIAMLKK